MSKYKINCSICYHENFKIEDEGHLVCLNCKRTVISAERNNNKEFEFITDTGNFYVSRLRVGKQIMKWFLIISFWFVTVPYFVIRWFSRQVSGKNKRNRRKR